MKTNILEMAKGAGKECLKFARKNSRTIMAFGAGAGVVATAVFSVRAGVRAEKIVARKKAEVGIPEEENLPAKEVIGLTWKEFVWPFTTAVGTVACVAGVETKASKALNGAKEAYNLLEASYVAQKDAITEEVGPKKLDKIESSAAQKLIDRSEHGPLEDADIVRCPGGGNEIFYDPLSGRFFFSNYDRLLRIKNEMNTDMIDGEMYYSVNDFFTKVGLKRVDLGEDRGWNVDKEHQIAFHRAASSFVDAAGNERLCWDIIYDNPPVYNFDNVCGYVC